MHEISHPTYHPSKQQYFASIYFAAQGYDRYLWSYSCDIYVGFRISGLLLVWTIRQFQVHRRILWDDCDQSRWMIFPGTLSWRNCSGTIVNKTHQHHRYHLISLQNQFVPMENSSEDIQETRIPVRFVQVNSWNWFLTLSNLVVGNGNLFP